MESLLKGLDSTPDLDASGKFHVVFQNQGAVIFRI